LCSAWPICRAATFRAGIGTIDEARRVGYLLGVVSGASASALMHYETSTLCQVWLYEVERSYPLPADVVISS
jgi:hypothetical protein